MITKKYQTQIEVDLVPEYHDKYPEIIYGIDHPTQKQILTGPITLIFLEELSEGPHHLIIELCNKQNADCIPDQNLDMTVIINSVRIGGIALPRFVWISEYTPVYPEPWFSEQDTTPDPVIKGASTLGHNGRWQINFDSPVFPWIHKVEQMGWIWPID